MSKMSKQVLKAVILVGGPSRGTRFRPLSLGPSSSTSTPKPLFPIAGYPMIYHHIKALAALEDQGLKEILIIGFFAEESSGFSAFVNRTSKQFPQVQIKYLREFESLGTGGGLYHFRDQILYNQTDLFFVLHADICCSFPLQSMLDAHLASTGTTGDERLCTILGTKVPKDTSSMYGCIVKDETSSRVLHYVEKPETFISDLISCGIYLFDKKVFENMHSVVMNASLENTVSKEVVRLEQDILRPLAGTGKFYVHETKDFWRQIKTAGSTIPANQLYLKNQKPTTKMDPETSPTIVGNVFIHDSAKVHPSATIGPNVSISANVVIGESVRVRDAIILENVKVQDYSVIMYSVIGKNSRIGKWCRIEGTPSYAANPKLKSTSQEIFYDLWSVESSDTDLMLANGMKNDSVTIVGDESAVWDELIIRNCIVLPQKSLRKSYKNEILM